MAACSTQGKSKHGAVIVRGSTPRSAGWNKQKYTKTVATPKVVVTEGGGSKISDWTRHAEIDAIRNHPNPDDLRGCDLYVGRFNKKGQPSLSAPCPLCMAEIRSVGIKRVFFTTQEKGVFACIKIS